MDAASVEFMGWKAVKNGELLRRAMAERFEVLVTADRLLAATPPLLDAACLRLSHLESDASGFAASADRIEAACLAVLPGEVLAVQV